MNQTGMDPNERSKHIQTMNILTYAFAVAPIMYYYVALNVPSDGHNTEGYEIIKNIFIGISIICAIAGLMVMNLKPEKFKKLARAFYPPSPPAQHQMLAAMAIHEAIAVYGLVYYFMTGVRDFLNLAVPVSIVLILVDRARTKLESLPPTDS